MSDADPDKPPLGPRILGWAVLLLGLPLALFGALSPPNEYKAIFGGNALDCDGPFGVYMFAIPAFLIYGAALVIHARRWRRPLSLVVALVSAAICIALAANLARATAEQREQTEACEIR